MNQLEVGSLFNLPLSVEAFDQWQFLETAMQNLPWSAETHGVIFGTAIYILLQGLTNI